MTSGVHIHQRTLDQLLGAPAATVGAYVLVSHYMARKGLGGRIAGARAWSEKTWLMSCGITRRNAHDLVTNSCAFWHENDYVFVTNSAQTPPAASPSVSLSKKEETKEEEAGGSAQARETAAASTSNLSTSERRDRETDIRSLLLKHGIPANALDLKEWSGGMNRVVRAKTIREADAFLRWAVSVIASRGGAVLHWRNVAILGAEWNSRRAELFPSENP